MKQLARRLSLLCVIACAVFSQTKPAAPPRQPKLVLMIVVDQFRYDYLTRFRSEYTGGLARLLDKGAVFTNAYYEHYPTVTAVGHSTVLTGAPPAISGIVGNEWLDRSAGKMVTSVSDPSVETLGAPARLGSSPHRLLVSTLSDEIKMADRSPNKSIGISLKDRSAILPVGRMADAAFWFDNDTGNFVSSTYYMKELPAWMAEFNRSRFADKFVGAEWTSSSRFQRSSGTSPQPVFARMPSSPGKAYWEAVYRSPFGNDVLAEAAMRVIDSEKLGASGGTDLLSVSFSSNDAIGHFVGPDAPEVHDMCLKTDRVLEMLLQFVDKKVGLANTLVVLTADHGVAPSPEANQKRHMAGGRLSSATIMQAVTDALNAKYGVEKWIVGREEVTPYLDRNLIRKKGLDLAAVQATAAEAVRPLPHIARVYTSEDVRLGRLPEDYITRRIRNGFYDGRGADLVVLAEPYYLFDGKAGTSHGSPYNYDSHVPVIFLGPWVRAGQYHASITVNDIAPTLATMLAVETPSGSIGRVLNEMLPARLN
jgi:predicted AlkP superfamily pyrophosphatase or phosphodiesterase